MNDRKITLGGKEYIFSPLTLGQMKAVGIGSAKQSRKVADPAADEANWYDGSFEIVAAATGMKLEDVQKIQGVKLAELVAAVREILDSCGLLKMATAGAAPPGGATGATG